MTRGRWNSNLHAFETLLGSVPDGAQQGLDVGCGEGETARRLRERVGSVIGLDPDRASIAAAREHDDDIDYRVGPLADTDLPEASFDVVTAVAMLHHVDHVTGLGGWLPWCDREVSSSWSASLDRARRATSHVTRSIRSRSADTP